MIMVSSFAMTACGGGGDSPASPPVTTKAEGVYSGTLTGSTSSAFQLLVLENDEYWTVYGRNTPGMFLVTGVVQGQGISTNTTFTSSNAKDFGVSPPTTGTITANYVVDVSMNGTLSLPGGTVTFSGAPIVRTTYDYNAAANPAAIVGVWSLTALDGSVAALNIGSTGAITGNSGGCTFTGTIAPRASGKNVFNTSVTFGPAPCLRAGQTATGIGLSYPIAGTATRQLVIVGVDSGRTAGTALFGTR